MFGSRSDDSRLTPLLGHTLVHQEGSELLTKLAGLKGVQGSELKASELRILRLI